MSPREFWSWFVHQQDRIVWPLDPSFVDEIGERLEEIDPGLEFELVAGEPPLLAISAAGIPSLFGLVREIVRCAPALESVHVVAFKQRAPVVDAKLRCPDGRTLTCEDIWFRLKWASDGFGLFLFVRDLPAEDPRQLQTAVHLLLDSALGEEDVGTKIQWIEWASLPTNPSLAALLPLIALPERFDEALGRLRH